MSWFGIDFAGWSKAQLNAARFFFDALFPFLILFLLSPITKPVPKPDVDRFFAKMHTPIQPTPAAEAKALAESYADPDKFRSRKIWPRSNWEIMKPGWKDVLGFGGSWILVGVILFLLWLMVHIK